MTPAATSPGSSGVGAADTLADWLRRSNLGDYEAAFVENDITLDLLSDLTDEDLRELGLSMGNRKRFRKAVEAENEPLPAPHPPLAAGAATQTKAPPAHATAQDLTAQRRNMSVMFVDLVGSTRMSRTVDPEEMGHILRSFQDAVSGELMRYHGYVAKFMGDGILAYFGWPTAREDDTAQVTRAGLAVLQAVSQLTTPKGAPLQCRVGIATGLVVVGDLLGENEAKERTVTGDTPNLAARLQTAASPGSVLISTATMQLIDGMFELERIEGADLKGFDGDEAAFEVIREVEFEKRFDARAHGRALPTIGRDKEITQLMSLWESARLGRGRGIVIHAEAGVGKSRLLQALESRINASDFTPIRLQCSPNYTDIAFWPVIQHLRHALNLEAFDGAAAQKAHVVERLGQLAQDTPVSVAITAELIGVDFGQHAELATLSARQLRHRTLDTLVAMLRQTCSNGPVFFQLEDAHWADPTTVDLTRTLLRSTTDKSCLIVVTTRPENAAHLEMPDTMAHLSLERLGAADCRRIVQAIDTNRLLDQDAITDILGRADGIPLFIEELTKARVDLVQRNTEARAVEDVQVPSIPLTLNDMLMSRLDHLDTVKGIAQTASCIGREFDEDLLLAVTEEDEDSTMAALDRLERNELIFRYGGQYVFKHALVRDAAYESLLISRRKAIHARIAAHLKEQGQAQEPDLVAQHAERAGDVPLAIQYYQRSGAEAVRRSANAEAISAYGNALRVIETLPPGPERDGHEISSLLSLGAPLTANEGYASKNVEANYIRARHLCERTGNKEQLFDSIRGLWTSLYNQGHFLDSLELTKSMIALSQDMESDLRRAIALRVHGSTNLSLDRFPDARDAYEKCRVVAASTDQTLSVVEYGEDPMVSATIMLAQVASYEGQLDYGWRLVKQAEDIARASKEPISIVQAAAVRSIIALLRRDYAICLDAAEEEARLSQEHGFVHWQAHSEVMIGVSRTYLDPNNNQIKRAINGIENWRATGAQLYMPTFCAYLADCAISIGRLDIAERATEDGLHYVELNQERLVLAELHRLSGIIAFKRGDANLGLERLGAAISTATSQAAWLFNLRSQADRVEVLASVGRAAEAKDALQDAMMLVTEHKDGPDYKRALALVESSKIPSQAAH